MAFELVDDLGTRLLVATNEVTQLLGIQAFRQRRRPYQIAEHHCELAALSLLRRAGRGVETGNRLVTGPRCREGLAAFLAELVARGVCSPALRTGQREPCSAFRTELRVGWSIVLAPRALHPVALLRPGRLDFLDECANLSPPGDSGQRPWGARTHAEGAESR